MKVLIVVAAAFVGAGASSPPDNSADGGAGFSPAPHPTVSVPLPIPPRGHIALTMDGLYLISTGRRMVLWESPEGQEVARDMSANSLKPDGTFEHRRYHRIKP